MRPRFKLVVSPEDDGRRLDDVVAAWLPKVLQLGVSRSWVRRLIMAGAVRLDGRPSRRPGLPLGQGQELIAEVVPARVPGAGAAEPAPAALSAREVLWEDEWLIAFAKPAGLAFHPTADARRPSLVEAARQLLRERLGRDEPPYLGVHQRLDVGTTGVALFVLRPEANAGLARALAEQRVTKTYHALTQRPRGLDRRAWTIEAPLALESSRRQARMVPSRRGQPARTDVRVLRILGPALLVEARPHTGRKHQVRAHLAGEGLPLLGDVRYGGPAEAGGVRLSRPMLHALRLELPHPVTGVPLVIECPYAQDFLAALGALASRKHG